MKSRNGFVSNSSSSSFILAWKGNYDEDDLRIMFKVPCNIPYESPLHGLTEQVFNTFIENMHERFDTIDDYAKWAEENFYMMDEYKEIKSLLENGFTVQMGSFSTDEAQNPIEYFLASHEFNYSSDDFVIIHDGVF